MKKNTEKIIFRSVIGVLFLLLIVNQGFRRLLKTILEIRSKKYQIAQLSQENEYLKKEIYRLKTDEEYRERMVRKELGYIRPGEREYRIKVKNE